MFFFFSKIKFIKSDEILQENLLFNKLFEENETILNYKNLLLCPTLENITNLKNHIGQGSLLIETLEESDIIEFNEDIQPGGRWKPKNCCSRDKVYFLYYVCFCFL